MQDAVVLANFGFEFFRKQNRLHQVGHAQTGAGGFVAVSGTDPPLGCSNFGAAFAPLPLFVEQTVIRQDEMRAVADQQVMVDLDPKFAQAIDFASQKYRIDHDPVADHADFAAAQDS